MPTLLAMPWPSGPVVVSTPEVRWYSGWPGHLLPSWRKCFRSSSATAGVPSRSYSASTETTPVRCKQRIEQGRGVPRRQHEAVAVGPDRVGRVEAQKLLPQGVDHRRHRHRRPGMAGIGLLHRVDAQGPDGVDAKLVDRPRGYRHLSSVSGKTRLTNAAPWLAEEQRRPRRRSTRPADRPRPRSGFRPSRAVRARQAGCRAGSPA